MQSLFTEVLEKKDLSKAGDLFSLDDAVVIRDFQKCFDRIYSIISSPNYIINDNDQSVVEICINRITYAIRELKVVDQHASSLVSLLECCLCHDLKPNSRGEDPPHAKIASEIISCLFLNCHRKEVMRLALPVAVKFLHKGNKELSCNMSKYLSLAAVHNADLLAQSCVQPIIDSVIAGNYGLSKVLPQIYSVKYEPLHDHGMALVSLLIHCEEPDKLALLGLFEMVARRDPKVLEPSLAQLCEGLSQKATLCPTMAVFLQMARVRAQPFADLLPRLRPMAHRDSEALPIFLQIVGAVGRMNKERAKDAVQELLQSLNQVSTSELEVPLKELTSICDHYPALLTEKVVKEAESYAQVCQPHARSYLHHLRNEFNTIRSTTVNQTPGGVTIVKVGGSSNSNGGIDKGSGGTLNSAQISSNNSQSHSHHNHHQHHPHHRLTPTRMKLGSLAGGDLAPHSRSTGKLANVSLFGGTSGLSAFQPPSAAAAVREKPKLLSNLHHSTSKLTSPSGKVTAPFMLYKSLSAIGGQSLVSAINTSPAAGSSVINQQPPTATPSSQQPQPHPAMSNVAVSAAPSTTVSVQQVPSSYFMNRQTGSPASWLPLDPNLVGMPGGLGVPVGNHHFRQTGAVSPLTLPGGASRAFAPTPTNFGLPNANNGGPHQHHQPSSSAGGSTMVTTFSSATVTTVFGSNPPPATSPVTTNPAAPPPPPVTYRKGSTSVLISGNQVSPCVNLQRISVFEPYPMRDAVQHFCEKHLDKIKAYMHKIFVTLPLPVRCTIEERKNKKHARLHFACQGKGEHCLYAKTFFTMKTRQPRLWVHLMFLALQARSAAALSTRELSVSSLKNCWDTLKCENRAFVTLVTSAFPNPKEQEALIHELRHVRFFDVFEYNALNGHWGCFLCNHPERAIGFLQEDQPVIEGQLKEKKGKWRLFRRWRTRYFTLSGGHLSYRGSKNDKEGRPIDITQIRSVKTVSRNGRQIPKAFEIFTDDTSLVLKAQDGKHAEEWIQCLSVAVAHSQAKEGAYRTLSSFGGSGSLR